LTRFLGIKRFSSVCRLPKDRRRSADATISRLTSRAFYSRQKCESVSRGVTSESKFPRTYLSSVEAKKLEKDRESSGTKWMYVVSPRAVSSDNISTILTDLPRCFPVAFSGAFSTYLRSINPRATNCIVNIAANTTRAG
jgi:hypothetical protein